MASVGLLGLVADYGSSSDNEEDNQALETYESELAKKITETPVNFFESIPIKKKKIKKKKSQALQSPELLANPLRRQQSVKLIQEAGSSVFFNPFQNEQEAKDAVLEKHVKMTTNTRNVNEINGKRICWNYRKGRCKFGHNCKYAHDSDLIGNPANIPSNALDKPDKVNNSYNEQNFANDELQHDTEESVRKRKPGLAKGLVPNKKSRKNYRDIQLKEKPWKNIS